jgi:hypothetical protein
MVIEIVTSIREFFYVTTIQRTIEPGLLFLISLPNTHVRIAVTFYTKRVYVYIAEFYS